MKSRKPNDSDVHISHSTTDILFSPTPLFPLASALRSSLSTDSIFYGHAKFLPAEHFDADEMDSPQFPVTSEKDSYHSFSELTDQPTTCDSSAVKLGKKCIGTHAVVERHKYLSKQMIKSVHQTKVLDTPAQPTADVQPDADQKDNSKGYNGCSLR